MSASRIEYSEKYADEMNEYRYVKAESKSLTGTAKKVKLCQTFCSSNTMLEFFFSFSSFSHVILPKELAKTLPKSRLLTESEWRGIGVQQSRGWQHYAIHRYVLNNAILLQGTNATKSKLTFLFAFLQSGTSYFAISPAAGNRSTKRKSRS